MVPLCLPSCLLFSLCCVIISEKAIGVLGACTGGGGGGGGGAPAGPGAVGGGGGGGGGAPGAEAW